MVPRAEGEPLSGITNWTKISSNLRFHLRKGHGAPPACIGFLNMNAGFDIGCALYAITPYDTSLDANKVCQRVP